MSIEVRKIYFNKSGLNQVCLPKSFLDAIGVNPENPHIKLILENGEIKIKKI